MALSKPLSRLWTPLTPRLSRSLKNHRASEAARRVWARLRAAKDDDKESFQAPAEGHGWRLARPDFAGDAEAAVIFFNIEAEWVWSGHL